MLNSHIQDCSDQVLPGKLVGLICVTRESTSEKSFSIASYQHPFLAMRLQCHGSKEVMAGIFPEDAVHHSTSLGQSVALSMQYTSTECKLMGGAFSQGMGTSQFG